MFRWIYQFVGRSIQLVVKPLDFWGQFRQFDFDQEFIQKVIESSGSKWQTWWNSIEFDLISEENWSELQCEYVRRIWCRMAQFFYAQSVWNESLRSKKLKWKRDT